VTPKMIGRAEIAAENDIYLRLGRVLLEMVQPEHASAWSEVLLHVEHVTAANFPEAYVMETTAVLEGGERLPLVARPEIMALSRELDDLCREQSGKVWRTYDFRVYHGARGPSFQCRYTYPDTMH
jgi:hypothetical protein